MAPINMYVNIYMLHISLTFLLINILLILFFAILYKRCEGIDDIDGLLYSLQIQTLSGTSYIPKRVITKVLIILQNLLGFILAMGSIALSIDLFKDSIVLQ